MAKKIISLLLCGIMLISFTGCSPAETISGWFDEIEALIPNDIELIISQILGTEIEKEPHEIILSEGYVNMLKSGTYNMVYNLADGTEVMHGSNGLRIGSSYPEPSEAEQTEPEYDDEGNLIEPDIPQEHIVLFEGIYYYIDDAKSTMFTVNPENYKAVPFEIYTDGIKLSATGTESFSGKDMRFERYSTDKGDITFYYENTVLRGMKISQGSEIVIENITAFNKYLNPSLTAMPESYKIVNYWTAEE